jgi:hypothetical protein
MLDDLSINNENLHELKHIWSLTNPWIHNNTKENKANDLPLLDGCASLYWF